MATVTVVIPVWNDAHMLQRALHALAAQSRRPDAVIVVDNGCTDDSVAVACRAGARVVSEPRRGIPAATARGFDAAGTDVLARIDADSRPGPDWLRRVMDLFESQPELAALTGTGAFYDGSPIVRALGRRLYLGGYFFWLGLLLGRPPLYGSNCALRAQAWAHARAGIHRDDPRVHDDLDISFHLPDDAVVRFDADLTMPVSARPFATVGGTARRVGWGFRTVWVNVRSGGALARRRRVLVARRARADRDRHGDGRCDARHGDGRWDARRCGG